MQRSQEGDIVYVVCRKYKYNEIEERGIRGYDVVSIHMTQEGANAIRNQLRASPFNEDYRIWVNSYFLKV